ncbi:MAG: RsmG family class I SAM-dependent methyltransferase, partial [Sphingomicrobium sp.]
LGLDSQIVCAKAERVEGKFDVITARAVAPLTEFIELSLHLSTRKSHWVLPKGRNAVTELVDAQAKWQGTFHVEHSLTDDASQIIVATDVRPKRT